MHFSSRAEACGSSPWPRVFAMVCVSIAMTGLSFGHPAGSALPSSPLSLLARQIPPSTSVNWWPYPSYADWGEVTSTMAGSAPTSLSISPEIMTPGGQSLAMATVSPPTTSTFSSSSSTSSGPLTRITALPPQSSSSSVSLNRNRQSQGSNFNIAYLAPFFAVLGAAAGGAMTWLLYRYLRPSQKHGSVLKPGPVYTAPSVLRRGPTVPDGLPVPANPTSSQSSRHSLLQVRQESGHSHVDPESSTSIPPLPSPARDNAEEDPFLSTPNRFTSPASVSRRGTMRTSSRQVTSPGPYDTASDGEDAVPYETIRHKSIRRGILDRLKFGTLRRPRATYERGHTEDTDETGKHDQFLTPSRSIQRRTETNPPTPAETPSRRPTASRQDSQLVKSPSGFRIFLEDPESGVLHDDDGMRVCLSRTPTKATSTIPRDPSDKFTPKPVRRTAEDKRNSPFLPTKAGCAIRTQPSTPTSTEPTTSPSPLPRPAPALPRVDSSVLPASPRRVMSPPLDAQLCFGSSPSLTLLQFTPAVSAASPKPQAGKPHIKRDHGRVANKLHTARQPPLMPFPSTPTGVAAPFRGKLKKAKHADANASPPVPPKTAERSDTADSAYSASEQEGEDEAQLGSAPSGRGTTAAERYVARRTALSRVEEIVSRGWGEREGAFLGSPNNFGDFDVDMRAEWKVDVEDALAGAGIEQRLEAVRGSW